MKTKYEPISNMDDYANIFCVPLSETCDVLRWEKGRLFWVRVGNDIDYRYLCKKEGSDFFAINEREWIVNNITNVSVAPTLGDMIANIGNLDAIKNLDFSKNLAEQLAQYIINAKQTQIPN